MQRQIHLAVVCCAEFQEAASLATVSHHPTSFKAALSSGRDSRQHALPTPASRDSYPRPPPGSLAAPRYITRTAPWQPVFVTGRVRGESERERASCAHAVPPSQSPIDQHAGRMDKPSVWRAVVSSTDPRRMREPGSHPSRPGSAIGYRLYDM